MECSNPQAMWTMVRSGGLLLFVDGRGGGRVKREARKRGSESQEKFPYFIKGTAGGL